MKVGCGRLDEAALSPGAEPVAVAADGQDVAVVQEAVEDSGGDHRIGEHRAPFGNAAVGSDQHGAGFVAPADELEEQVGGVGFQRQVTELVDDQQFGLRRRQQFLVQAPLAVRLGQAGNQHRRRGELHRVSGQDRLAPERDRKMRLADAWRAEQQHILAVGDPA